MPQVANSRRTSFTAIIQREGRLYVALCPELDIASQGRSLPIARRNLQEAVELFLETASSREIKSRLHTETYISSMDVVVGR
ncbi:MAG: type II toxin-antitoxin system HicB family antitoxin [Acidobacteriaceae bacterium]